MVKLSIIMPVYNASDYLDNSLNSIFKQNIDDIEVICINDGSADNSRNILEEYAEKYEFVKVFNQENQGPAKSRNKGIMEANGDYLAFLDSDDIYLDNNALSNMYDVAIKYDADIVCANLRRIKQNGQLEEDYDHNDVLFTYFDDVNILEPYEYGIPWAFYKNIYKKDFLLKNNIIFPDLIAGEDPIFLANVLTTVSEIVTVNKDLYGYNHSVSGGLNIKLNTFQKKYDYVSHFMQAFDILNKEGFEKVLADYKREFIDYLNFRQNIYDPDIIDIVKKILGDDTYFDESDYGYLLLDLLKNGCVDEDSDYDFIKYCLFEESMLENTFIDVDRLNDFVELSENNDSNRKKSSFKQLKKIESNTFEEKRKINGDVDKLKLGITEYINSNNLILTSNSWKLTSYLRNIKHKI